MIQKRARNKLRYMEDPNYEYGTPNWQSLNAIYHAAIMQRKILFNVKWKPNIAASFHLRVWLFNPSTPQAPQRCNLTRKFNLAQRLIQNEEKSVGKTFFLLRFDCIVSLPAAGEQEVREYNSFQLETELKKCIFFVSICCIRFAIIF